MSSICVRYNEHHLKKGRALTGDAGVDDVVVVAVCAALRHPADTHLELTRLRADALVQLRFRLWRHGARAVVAMVTTLTRLITIVPRKYVFKAVMVRIPT